MIYGRVPVSTLLVGTKPHAEDDGWPRKNYPSTTSNANDNEVGATGEFEMAMSVAEADEILARFSEPEVCELAA